MRKRTPLMAALIGIVAVFAPVAIAQPAAAHGWITTPPSRQDHCAEGTVDFDCGGLEYEPQSVEAPKGSMKCSGGSQFAVLDDESKPWPRTAVESTVTMRWELTAMHATSTWEYFVDGELFRTFDDGGAKPGAVVEHELTGLPEGDHTILARWNTADTVNAFYACVDVTVGSGGGTTPPEDPAPEPPAPDPGECAVGAWSGSGTYTAGDQVSHDGRLYEAKWWTRGDDPTTASGQWDVWKDLGAC